MSGQARVAVEQRLFSDRRREVTDLRLHRCGEAFDRAPRPIDVTKGLAPDERQGSYARVAVVAACELAKMRPVTCHER